MTHLKELVINNNLLKEIPSEFGQLSKLEKLILNNNNIKNIPSELGELTKLRILNFSNNNHFVNLDCFPLLTNLTELTITNISIKLNSILSLTRLRKLNISNNYNYMGKEFLGHLSQLVNLNELIMSRNRHDKSETVALEYSLSKMPEITSLNISYTNLPAINLLSMQKLQKLDVSHIENIQYSIFISLTQLTSLNLDGFNIMTIQNLPILSCMTNLISLSLCNNQITSNGLLQLLPMFYRMKDLTTLELAYNHLRPRKDRAILLQEIPWLRTITLYTNKPHKKE
jgi:Leucine-rich repeat (LRR) protein